MKLLIILPLLLMAVMGPDSFARIDVVIAPPPVVIEAGSPAPPVLVEAAPPAPIVEVMPAPQPGFIWVTGFWGWEGGRHRWYPGHWMAHRPGYTWVGSRWAPHGRGYRFEGGHWRR